MLDAKVVELLNQQGDHEVCIWVFFRENYEHSTFFITELFRINGCVEAQDLLQL